MLTAVLGGDHCLKGLMSENLNSFLIRMGDKIRALSQKFRLVAVAVGLLRRKVQGKGGSVQCERPISWSTAKGQPEVAKKAGYTRLNGVLPPFVGQDRMGCPHSHYFCCSSSMSWSMARALFSQSSMISRSPGPLSLMPHR